MCDDGRLGYHYVNSIERFLRPMTRRDGQLAAKPWPEIIGSVRTDGQVFLDLMERRGLAHAPTLRKELATEVRFFSSLAAEGVRK